jgi:putative flippase GtrA
VSGGGDSVGAVDALSEKPPASSSLRRQLVRFVCVGVLSAGVDFSVYHLLLLAGTWLHAAKAISFVLGTTTAYLLNRAFTFDDGATGGLARFLGFVLLYGVTFFVNIGMNAAALAVLPADLPLRTSLAWVVAQGFATSINFVMLRFLIFRSPAER